MHKALLQWTTVPSVAHTPPKSSQPIVDSSHITQVFSHLVANVQKLAGTRRENKMETCVSGDFIYESDFHSTGQKIFDVRLEEREGSVGRQPARL